MSAKSDAMRDMAAKSKPLQGLADQAGGEADRTAHSASVIRRQRLQSAAKKALQVQVERALQDRPLEELAAQINRAASAPFDVTPGEALELAKLIDRHEMGGGLSRVSGSLRRIAERGDDVSVGRALARYLATLILGDYSVSQA